jgi:hypothetical protein
MQIIRAGVDSLYLPIKGTVPTELLAALAAAKAQAATDRRDAPISLAGDALKAMVSASGQAGGFAFVFDTGPPGARFACREASDKPDWNLFVKPHASALLALGFWPVCQKITDTLAAIGGQTIEISLNRIDYAIDIRADDFSLDLDRFIAHPRAKRHPHWSATDVHHPAAVLTGRRLESVTIGKMPGKQVIVYDKTAEVRAKDHPHWFAAWQIDPAETAAHVWRVELRLGRNELKKARRIRTFDDLQTGFRPALCDLMQQVRYVAAGEADPNVSRRRPDPIWQLARQHIDTADLLGGAGDLPPSRLLAITQEMKIDCHKKLIIGNAASLAAVMDWDDPTVDANLPGIIGAAVGDALPTTAFRRSIARARTRCEVMFNAKP